MKPIASIICLIVCVNASAIDHQKLLTAIGNVESGMNRSARGDHGLALGAYQMHQPAWIDANRQLQREGKTTYPRHLWTSPAAQDDVALAYLRWICDRLKNAGVKPNPQNVYLCFTMGFEAARKRSFNIRLAPAIKANAAQRVATIFQTIK